MYEQDLMTPGHIICLKLLPAYGQVFSMARNSLLGVIGPASREFQGSRTGVWVLFLSFLYET